ncbi:tRNA pseudouridine(13) synthase TruD [Nitrincola tapanii]|uniref:tRNA pseudouridine synthase D n=1 Tax=Nitrincola tapanii TaxID=1708751 RepID=A0A5A9W296_9GAMM|nr:tRNA pseudouridine(13) synthase TruD [Nitrincola tapanii]KAA0874683.1 tRNA pseudouridine(13) synthase TruD [Nitrincola tapanii]
MTLVAQLQARPEAYLYGEPQAEALIRHQPEDFRVDEILGFEPEGEGEHLFLQIEKIGENTDWVARQLAKFMGANPREIGYAGKKDRHAITTQWFSVKHPIKAPNPSWGLFNSPTIRVLQQVRHSRKLKLGSLQGNRFSIRLREVTHPQEVLQRCALLEQGVPNYFGEQRFGHQLGNLIKGEAMLAGQLKERQSHKRGLYISALRSALFNQVVSERIQQGRWSQVQFGDVLMLNGSQSCFLATDDLLELEQRLYQQDVHLTAPMWGVGPLMTQAEVAEQEARLAQDWSVWTQGLEGLGLKQERRAMRLVPQALQVERIGEQDLLLSFTLTSGAFATSVLRECVKVRNERSSLDHE